ncbi:MAG: hypothetical protein ACREOW_05950 [Thermodesulfobacteriota bacterium]
MKNLKFQENHKAILDKILWNMTDVREGKIFGFPPYQVGNKLFAFV